MHQPNTQTMSALFAQLGMEGSDRAIADFIRCHQLDDNTNLKRAHFWTEAQRQFLEEAWVEDSDWCNTIDQLDVMLHDASFAPATH